MNRNAITTTALVTGSAILWLFNFYTLSCLFSGNRSAHVNTVFAENNNTHKAIALADSALKEKPHAVVSSFTAIGESPFKSDFLTIKKPGKKTQQPVSSTPPSDVKLTLKGVLMKQTPLAILEDASGKTSVCGVGEKVADQLIVKIEYTRVTLQNGRSTYTLTVKE